MTDHLPATESRFDGNARCRVADHSFAVLVYPFSFDRTRFDRLVVDVNGDALDADDTTWTIWERRSFPQDDLLRHVADYLNPDSDVPPTACLWTLEDRVLRSPHGLGLRPGSLALSLRHRRPANAAKETTGHAPDDAIALQMDGIDLALFRVGIGYLMFRVRIPDGTAADWFDLLHGIRFIDRPGKVDLLLSRRTGKDRVEPFWPPLATASDDAGSGRGTVGHLVGGLLGRVFPANTPGWRELYVRGEMLPFHALFFEGVPESEDALLLYRLRNFFRTAQPLHPSAEDLQPNQPALLPYAHRMWFSGTLEGGGFVAFDAPNTLFWSETMPEHLAEQYFLLFLLALHQRFALMHLSEQVCEHWLGAEERVAETRFASLREALLEFTARGYFTQVMQREHHHRCFRAWRAIFEIESLFREVNEEVRELHGMLLMRKTERMHQLAEEQREFLAARERVAQARATRLGLWFSTIAILLGFPSITIALLQHLGVSSVETTLLSLGGSLLLGALLIAGIAAVAGRMTSRPDDDSTGRSQDSRNNP